MKEVSYDIICSQCGKSLRLLPPPNSQVLNCMWCNLYSINYPPIHTCSICCSSVYVLYNINKNKLQYFSAICANIDCPGYYIKKYKEKFNISYLGIYLGSYENEEIKSNKVLSSNFINDHLIKIVKYKLTKL